MASTNTIQKTKPVFIAVNELKPGTHGHNLKVKVVSSNIVLEKTRSDSSKTRIAECLVGDSTGSVILTARNDQIDRIQIGKPIIIRNAKVDMFKGFMRLAVDKWGKIESSNEPANYQPNTDNNLSNIEYELVTVDEE